MSPLARLIQFLRTRRLGRFQLGELLGSGAMGEVYRAWDPELQRWVALKILPPQASSEQRARFEREATLSTRFRQRNAVGVLEHGTAADLQKLLSSPGMVGTGGRKESEAIPACKSQGGHCGCSHNLN